MTSLIKEEGTIIEFDPVLMMGKVRCVHDEYIDQICGSGLKKTKIDLHTGDKVLFASIEN